MTILYLIFGRSDIYISILGFLALGLESTLPIPQFIRYEYLVFVSLLLGFDNRWDSNYKQKSLYGFRMSTLIGWVGGDSFKYGSILSR